MRDNYFIRKYKVKVFEGEMVRLRKFDTLKMRFMDRHSLSFNSLIENKEEIYPLVVRNIYHLLKDRMESSWVELLTLDLRM